MDKSAASLYWNRFKHAEVFAMIMNLR